MRGGLLEVGEQRAVGQHRALRPAARAGGVEQHREVLARRRRSSTGCPAARVEQLVPRRRGRRRRRGRARAPAARRRATAAASRPAALTTTARAPLSRQRPAQLLRGVAGVERHGDQPGPQHAEVGDREVEGVGQAERRPGRRAAGRARRGRPRRRRPARRPRARSSTSAPDRKAGLSGERSAAARTSSLRLPAATLTGHLRAPRRRWGTGGPECCTGASTPACSRAVHARRAPTLQPRRRSARRLGRAARLDLLEDLPRAVVDLRRQRAAVDLLDAVDVLHAAAGPRRARRCSARRRSPSTRRCRRRGPRASSRRTRRWCCRWSCRSCPRPGSPGGPRGRCRRAR